MLTRRVQPVLPRERLARCRSRTDSMATSNCRRASSVRPSRASSSPRTLGSRWDPASARRDQLVDDPQRRRGPCAIETATARFSSTTGRGCQPSERLVEHHDPLPVGVLDRRGDRVALGDRRLEPVCAEPATDPTGPAERGAAPSDRARSQRRRSWSSSSTGSPSGPVRAGNRAAVSSSRARRPCTSGSSGIRWARTRARRTASCARSGRIKSSPGRRRRSLGEDHVDDAEHRAEPLPTLVAAAAPRTGPAPPTASSSPG